MGDVDFDRSFEPAYDTPVPAAPEIRRVTARNPGPFTFRGTNTYIVGRDSVAIIDPGPEDETHTAALIAATAGETVRAIALTHSHRDHSGGAARLAMATGAPIFAGRGAALAAEVGGRLDAASDAGFKPDVTLGDGDVVDGDDWRLDVVATPGHASDHLAFVLEGSGLLFSGDHVMAWSTTVVAPPDGSMADYMASLDRLLARPEDRYLPGHGGPVVNAHAFVRSLKNHRRMREATILDRIAKGDRTIPAIVAAIYRDTDPALHGAAGLSVLAHLEDLVARGLVATDGAARIDGAYRPATAP